MARQDRRGQRTAARVVRKVGRLVRLPAREKATTLHAAVALLVVELLIRWVRLPRLAGLAGVTLEAGSGTTQRADVEPAVAANGRPEEVRRAVRSTRRVLSVWPFGKGPCLRESLVLGHLLRNRAPLLRIGVANRDQGLLAHAWLEVEGRALGDSRGFVTFDPLDGYR